MLLEQEREGLAAAGRRLAAGGLVIGTSGNLSARAGDLVAVTPTGGVIGELTPAMMTVLDLEGQVVEGDLAPTSEVPMHLAVYRATGAGAITHTHAVASTAIACTLEEIPVVHYAMLALGGSVRVAPYATYGTAELAAHVVTALEGRQAALLRNHGSIALGPTVEKAVGNLELTEWAAELYARCLALGTPHLLGRQAQEDVVARALADGYGTTRKL
ncbi:class II aldolase/adducin family protein [Streptomyces sp. SBT349]|uniref:class II aldolase/adducin family protein n=1 Tax=Streptomyces sp. SBT349 TaxID=1580539 RepID=UPI00066C43E5|nr:class II aldolase/adducin family protein [Streptomyces sp. SBT349]